MSDNKILSLEAYIKTARWASGDDGEYDVDAFMGADYRIKLTSELSKFWDIAKNLFTREEIDNGAIEHDFFLTRNGHGAGFWDGNYECGDELTAIAEGFGEDYGY